MRHIPCHGLQALLNFRVMIRSFQLRDFALIHRIGEKGVLLQAEAALIHSSHPVRRAILGKLAGGRIVTFVWKSENRQTTAYAQLSWKEGRPSAHLVCLGTEHRSRADEPEGTIDEESWLELLDELAVEAGRSGAHSLIAEASENGPELPILRRAGYAIYTRQDIWIAQEPVSDEPYTILHPHQSVDDWDVSVLYSNVVPGLIQSVEPNPPQESGSNWILREDDELAAFVHLSEGSAATWLRLLIHPNAHTKPKEIIQAAAGVVPPSSERPMYCCIRRYQSWLQNALERAGFQYWGSQAVMVKNIIRRVENAQRTLEQRLESQAIPGSSSLVQSFSQPNGKHRNH